MASTPPIAPDPRTAADDDEVAIPGVGVSSPAPAEGPDDEPADGSPAG